MPSNDAKIKATYKRLSQCKTSDVILKLHETLKNLDIVWLKRLLLTIPVENQTMVEGPNWNYPLISKNTSGSVLMLMEMFAPYLTITAVLLTHQPAHLDVSQEVAVDDSPFRIVFLGADINTWESSAIERLDLISPDNRYAPLKGHKWMLTLQGHKPAPSAVPEQAILPRLKLGLKAPNFDFTKLR